ncbi:MAG: Hsp20/alpha crystallin family protein [Candidatus Thermoplasmatota archaeon]|nr:Hsp20/alpha crystallin family protein [Candidatus Thermoplasmatota archaeon]MDD5778743.1 Hsp20/alpha crystallin family protein [Candidatus Thermoplasmatota archaeon]
MADEDEHDQQWPPDDEEFERILREMEKIVGEAFRDSFEQLKSGKMFVKGFSIRLGPDGSPRIDEYGHQPTDAESKAPEMWESDRRLSITLQLPAVDEEDIRVDVEETRVEVRVRDLDDCHHVIHLPQPVCPDSAAITYKNRILDIEVDKQI